MAVYVVRANAASPNNTVKVPISIATGSGVTCRIVAMDISFDGADATKTPILCELVKTTGAPSGGASGTINQVQGKTRTAQFTSRINDTSDGSSPTILASWYIPTTTGFPYQFPLGREVELNASEFAELRVTTVTASGTPNYAANMWVEE